MGQWSEFETALAEFERVAVIFKEQETAYLRAKQEFYAHQEAYEKIKSEIIDRAVGLEMAQGRVYGEAFRVFTKVFGAKAAKEMWEFLMSLLRHGYKPSVRWRSRKPKSPVVYNGPKDGP